MSHFDRFELFSEKPLRSEAVRFGTSVCELAQAVGLLGVRFASALICVLFAWSLAEMPRRLVATELAETCLACELLFPPRNSQRRGKCSDNIIITVIIASNNILTTDESQRQEDRIDCRELNQAERCRLTSHRTQIGQRRCESAPAYAFTIW